MSPSTLIFLLTDGKSMVSYIYNIIIDNSLRGHYEYKKKDTFRRKGN